MRLGEASLAMLLAATLLGTPVAAHAAAAETTRTGAAVEGEKLGGHPLAWAMAALIAVVVGILVFSDDDEEVPVSP